jgi:ubiquinone/menaquinone biosynthesis C-methylase UbiE
METIDYVHGYSLREAERLSDQANTLSELLHHDSIFPVGSNILEAGCGIGAQTMILAKKNPGCQFTSVDISAESIKQAEQMGINEGITNVKFQVADIYNLPFKENSFDHVFVCFILEHIREPMKALKCLKKLIRPDGTITVIEGDHGSAYYYPKSKLAQKIIDCLVEAQAIMQGDSLIGRSLFPLLVEAGFKNCSVTPKVVYADNSLPHMVEGFTRNTFIAMVEGVKEQAIKLNLIDEATWNTGINDLYKTAGEEGTFNYTFFKAIALE